MPEHSGPACDLPQAAVAAAAPAARLTPITERRRSGALLTRGIIRSSLPTNTHTRLSARTFRKAQAIAEDERLPIGEHIHRFGEDILISLIMFARHDGALRLASLRRMRVPIFVSRRAFEERLGFRLVSPRRECREGITRLRST
jgi:hypothetical protein